MLIADALFYVISYDCYAVIFIDSMKLHAIFVFVKYCIYIQTGNKKQKTDK